MPWYERLLSNISLTRSGDLQKEEVVIAKQYCKGSKKASVLPLQKGKLYWVQQQSEVEGGWVMGHDGEGNLGLFLQVCIHTLQVWIICLAGAVCQRSMYIKLYTVH